jgi:hypothetical protein
MDLLTKLLAAGRFAAERRSWPYRSIATMDKGVQEPSSLRFGFALGTPARSEIHA